MKTFYKIPINTDLSNISYRCRKDIGNDIYIEYNQGVVGDNWLKLTLEELVLELGKDPFNENSQPQAEPTQLDIIEENQAIILLKLAELGL